MTPSRLEERAQAKQALTSVRLRHFWFVACLSEELPPGGVVGRVILGEPVAVWRGPDGTVHALQDRCLHRNSPLSSGRVVSGRLQCGYHGWCYDGQGRVAEVPSLGPDQHKIGGRCAPTVEALEREGFVYVRLERNPEEDFPPFSMPYSGDARFRRLRLVNRFENNLTNCVENFVDIPHTAYVHWGIFRKPKGQRLEARVERRAGCVDVEYSGETDNLGFFSWFLNPSGAKIRHTDRFFMPNITSVEYEAGPSCKFVITSQSVPVSDAETLVYTDLTYDFGLWNAVAAPLVRRQGQAVIDQDVDILALQMKTIQRFGTDFTHTPADVIHVFIESIQRELEAGRDPRALPDARRNIEFWV